MKNKTRLASLLLFFTMFVILSSPTYALTVDVSPVSPDSNNFIIATITGEFGTPGFSLDNTIIDTTNGINIDLFVSSPTNIVAQVITPFSFLVDVGRLHPGDYFINANLYIDNTLKSNAKNSVTVSPVPIPAPLMLLFSGLVALFSLGSRRKSLL